MPKPKKGAAKQAPPANAAQFTITRTFDAHAISSEALHRAEHLTKWMGRGTSKRATSRRMRAWAAVARDAAPLRWRRSLAGRHLPRHDPPSHISYTFAWEETAGSPDKTIVTLNSKHSAADQTHLRQPAPNEEERDGHRVGWNESEKAGRRNSAPANCMQSRNAGGGGGGGIRRNFWRMQRLWHYLVVQGAEE